MTKSRTLPAGDVSRACLILLLADGLPYRAIEKRLDIGGAGTRSSAAKKGARTRKRATTKGSASAKKGAAKRTRKTNARFSGASRLPTAAAVSSLPMRASPRPLLPT